MISREIIVPGLPIAQPRPRMTKRGHAYNPATADAWKASIIAEFADDLKRIPGVIKGPVRLEIEFFFPRPKSHYRTGKNAEYVRDEAPGWHTSRPDLDNLEKAVMDAMTAASVWLDDSQVARKITEKSYADIDVRPHARIKVWEMPR